MSMAFITAAQETYNFLDQQTDFSPNNKAVNRCLSDFIDAVLGTNNATTTPQSSIMNAKGIKKISQPLRSYFYRAEFETEYHFAKKQYHSIEDLYQAYNFGDPYSDLIKEELQSMQKAGMEIHEASNIVFVGSGPLPITAIEMHLQTGAQITCLDHDTDAVTVSRNVIRNLGLSGAIHIHQSDGNIFDYNNNDMVFVASMVHEKESVVAQIRQTSPKANICIRSVEHGVKEMLYEAVPIENIVAHGLSYRGQSKDVKHSTINTMLLFSPS